MRVVWSCFFLFILLIFSAFFALISGNLDLKISDVISVILYNIFGIGSIDPTTQIVIWNLRFPRILIAILVGISLASAGVIYQSIFRNPLVEPFILGASAGASFGASLAILLPAIFISLQISAFAFGLLAVFLAYILAFQKGVTNSVALVLSGVIVGSIFNSLVGIMKYLSEDSQLREITFWMMGGLYQASWYDIAVNASFGLPCFIIAFILAWKLNLLSLGDEEARSLGINPQIYKIIFIIIATLINSLSVSSVGIIAWIGLMMPHAARMLVGADNRAILPVAGLMGAIYLLICDTLARTLSSGEIPVGIIVSLLGAPFLLWILKARSAKLFG
ncbi:iron ABC transporter permease [Campylobacter sp. CX2-4080-23]|uniref:FecCD family ABC transporter permease n=1 Tax=Campylobacter porcelli TaxID=1660073 RepID=UPI002E987BBF|nr:iron ABC transporter permease [Campylobacter sp. CX2-4080-23]